MQDPQKEQLGQNELHQQRISDSSAVEDNRSKRHVRKAAWSDAREAAQTALPKWMMNHRGEDLDPKVLEECANNVRYLVEAKLGGSLGANQAAAFVAQVWKQLRISVSFRKERNLEEWSAIFPRYPKSEDGKFCLCLEPTDTEGIREAMACYGVCVVKVMTEEQAQETVAAMFEEVNQQRAAAGISGPTISPTDPSTWENENWPSQTKFLLPRPALHPVAFRNRGLENVRKVFSALFDGEERLHATIDNWGITRGGANNADWARCGLKPHWDINPWCFQSHIDAGEDPGYQGLIALADQTEETGCHLSLPGGTNFVKQWIRENPSPKTLNRKSRRPDVEDPIVKHLQAIPLRRGEMVIWSWGQLHGSMNNYSADMRLHQYARLYPAPEAGFAYDHSEHDRYSATRIIQRCLRDGFLKQEELERILPDMKSRRLFGLARYDDDKPSIEES